MKLKILITLLLLISQSNFIFNETVNDQNAIKKSVGSVDKSSVLNVDSAKSTAERKETSPNENEEGLVADEENDNQINTSDAYETNSDDKSIKLLPETKLEVHHVNESDNSIVDNLKASTDSDESILEKAKQTVKEYAQKVPSMEQIKETVSEHATVPSKIKETANQAKDLLEEEVEKIPSLSDAKEKTKGAYETAKDKVKEYTDKIPSLDEAKETLAEKVPSYDDLKEKVKTVAEVTKEEIKEQATVPTILKEAKEKVVDKLEETRDKMPTLNELKGKAQDFISEHVTVPSVIENAKEKVQDVYETAKEKTEEYMDKIPSMEEAKEKVQDVVEKAKEKVTDYAAKVPSLEDVKEKTSEWIDQAKEKTSDFSQVTQPSTIQEVTERTKELHEEIRKKRENDESLIEKSKETVKDFANKLPSMDEVKEKVGDFVEKQKDNLNLAKQYAENLYVTVDDVADEVVENSYILESEKPIEIHPADRMEELIEKSLEFDDYFDALVRKLRERFHIIDQGQYVNPVVLAIIFGYIALSVVYLIQYFYKRRQTQQTQPRAEPKTDVPKQKNGKKFYPPAPKIK